MKASRSWREAKPCPDERISTFYGVHHDTNITLEPEFSRHVHAPISDSYGASESLSAWRPIPKEEEKPK